MAQQQEEVNQQAEKPQVREEKTEREKHYEQPPIVKRRPIFNKVTDLTPNRLKDGFNLIVQALEEPRVFISRVYLDGTTLSVASVNIADHSGSTPSPLPLSLSLCSMLCGCLCVLRERRKEENV